MANENILTMTQEEFEVWQNRLAAKTLFGESSEESLVDILKSVLMESDPKAKAGLLLELANVSMTLADKTLGVKGLVTTAIVLKH